MELQKHIQGEDVLVIHIIEESLDASNVREFRDQMRGMLNEQTRVVLDMSSLKFVDSSGLGAMISCLREINGRKGDLALAKMTRSVLALFELMRMHRIFNIHDTTEGAVASFA